MVKGLAGTSLAAVAVAALLAVPAAAVAAPLKFAPPSYIDEEFPGGEPLIFTDTINHTIVYTSHEGTTHLYRPGLPSIETFSFIAGYRNQVKIWTSADGGKTFQRSNFLGATGFATDPSKNTGFSDPDLAQDAGGRIYNTGINLANDALFSSPDGGKNWDRGTAQCHEGDRPWIAGGRKDEAWLTTNALTEGKHIIVHTTDGGASCSQDFISGSGEHEGVLYSGNGKIYYDHARDLLIEPITSGGGSAIGISTGRRGDESMTPHWATTETTMFDHWPAIAIDGAGTVYVVWSDDARQEASGCNNKLKVAPNGVNMMYTKDLGKTWSQIVRVAAPADKRVLWPWITAGDAGKVNVVWYQSDRLADPDCEPAGISIYSATILNASDDAKRTIQTVDASQRPITTNNICQEGTGCVTNGGDRRLGDFFSNAIDERGCVIIASGDTMRNEGANATSLPIFIAQTSGPKLIGSGDCSGVPDPPAPPAPVPPAARPSTTARLGLPSSRRCLSRRAFDIRLRAPKGQRLASATVTVAGRRAKVRRSGGRLIARVDLRRNVRGRFTVKVVALTGQGRRVTETRRYRTCARKR